MTQSTEPPLGTWANPLRIHELGDYPAEYVDRPYIYVVAETGRNAGQVTKWYRSYGDYCD